MDNNEIKNRIKELELELSNLKSGDVSYDTTERKRLEAELQKSEERFQLLFNKSPLGYQSLDINGNFLEVNLQWLDTLGYYRDEVIGKWFGDFLSPAYQDGFRKRFPLFKAEGKIHSEFEMVHKNGNKLFIAFEGRIGYDTNGDFKQTHCILQDITERKKAELALKERENEFHSLAESMPQIVWTTSADGWNTYFNQQWMDYTGLTLEESSGEGWITPFHPEDKQRAWDAWQNAVKNIAEYSIECRIRSYDGTYHWWLVRGVPQIGEAGEIVKWFGTCTDIEKIKNAEFELKKSIDKIESINKELSESNVELILAKEKAEESDRLKTAFLANMSHEIRTPMNGILGFTELLKDPHLTVEEQQDFIQTIQTSGARMLNTINNIIDISKLESGMMKVDINNTNLNDKIEFTYKFFKPEVENKGLKFLFKNGLKSNKALIKTDNEKVYGILTNLIKNAIKFTYEGSIEFGYVLKSESKSESTVQNRKPELEFYVKDTGVGLPEYQKELIFERFRQGSDSLNRNYEGSGLGLSICKSYAEMLGGRIWVESHEGKGTTFYFTIPYNPLSEEIATVKEVVSEENKGVQIKKLKILIVEDDEISYSLLTRVIQKISAEVLHSITGVEAVEACRNNPDLDLVLMDIRMPQMNGLEATQRIRQFNTDVIIIAQTAYGFSSDCEKALEAGCNDYITKPINKTLLFELIKKHCNKLEIGFASI